MKISSILILLLLVCASVNLHAQQRLSIKEQAASSPANIAAQSLRAGNAVIAVQVNDSLGGRFNPFKGLFNIGTADNKPLLFLFPDQRYTSHFNVRVDGTVYSNNSLNTGAPQLPLVSGPIQTSDSTITCTYRISNVTIEQRLTAQRYTSTTGAILIQYFIGNNDAVPHQVGLLLMLDTNINGKDDARVWTSFGYRQGEHQFTAPFVPDYFQAFERNDLTNPGLVAQGTLVGRDAVRPDLLIIGQWSFLNNVQWDYTLQQIPFYDDSAVILRWNETRLAPNERRVIATYYGIGDVTTTVGGSQLALNLTAPNRLETFSGQLTPNPFEINLIVLNTGASIVTGVEARLNLPPGLIVASGEVASKQVTPANISPQLTGIATWKVLAQCPSVDDTLGFIVNVMAANAAAISAARTIAIPSCAASLPSFILTATPPSQTVPAGQAASYTVRMQPSGGFTGNVSLSLFPKIPDVTPTFTPVSINAATPSTLTLQTTTSVAPGNYNFIIAGAGGGLTRSDTVSLVALAGPDQVAPFTINHNPARGARNVPRDTEIMVEVRDANPGVDSSRITMAVNGVIVKPQITGIPSTYTLRYKPAAPFRDNQTVQVRISARDLASPPNQMTPDDIYSFTTVSDNEPPFTLDHFPARNATNVPPDTDIRIEVRDELAGVDRNSLTMQVDGQPVSPTVTPVPQGFLLQYKPVQNFRYNATVQVVVRARDLAQPANVMTPDTLRFSIIRDVEPPFTTDHQPAKGSSNASPNTNIVLHVRDLVAGVDLSAIVMTVNGATVSPIITGVLQDYKLEYNSRGNFAPGDTVSVSIAAQDLSFPPNVMLRETYTFVIGQELPDLAVTSLRPMGTFFVGLQGEVIGKIANAGSADASRAFNVQFRVDGGIQKDTTFTRLTAGDSATLRLPLRFQTTGTHEVELVVDTGDEIREVTEANNSQKLVVQISQTALSNRLIARPNPFTPNNDGYNDQIEFDYSGLALQNPSLQIFDANGIPVWSSHNGSGGRFIWNGRDDRGREVLPGVYLYSVRDQGNNVASGYVVVAR
ncbi:gliding motility-associated C-terminal domain-containing protein [candidate division KSB1 bacterium]|nr:gliding motility-associated C-terminal domain-containing protein [candidate division KSB1 bacterium]